MALLIVIPSNKFIYIRYTTWLSWLITHLADISFILFGNRFNNFSAIYEINVIIIAIIVKI